MKIQLHMFNHKCGPVRDVPEETSTTFKMILQRPPYDMVSSEGSPIREVPILNTICEFEWDGMFDAGSGARIYNLIDIYKQ
jgi:hypothetical protein